AALWAKATSSTTANKILITLSAIFKRAQRKGALRNKGNEAALAERLKVSREDDDGETVLPDRVYTQDDLRKLIEATVPGSFERVLVMIPALTGMRISEVLGLQWPAIDFKENMLSVKTCLVIADNKHGRELKSLKSVSSRRNLVLSKELAHELKLWKLKCPP